MCQLRTDHGMPCKYRVHKIHEKFFHVRREPSPHRHRLLVPTLQFFWSQCASSNTYTVSLYKEITEETALRSRDRRWMHFPRQKQPGVLIRKISFQNAFHHGFYKQKPLRHFDCNIRAFLFSESKTMNAGRHVAPEMSPWTSYDMVNIQFGRQVSDLHRTI